MNTGINDWPKDMRTRNTAAYETVNKAMCDKTNNTALPANGLPVSNSKGQVLSVYGMPRVVKGIQKSWG